mgnify:CR=1 FL=1
MKKSLVALAFGTLALGIAEFVMMAILPYVAGDLHVSIATAGHLISAYALGGAQGALNAAANTPIAFPSFVAQPAASVTQNAGTFTLVTPGTYLVTAVLNPPPGSALATDAVLRANGTPISSTQTRIANGDNAASYTLQTLVTSTGATTVSLTASGALALTGTTPEDTLASITFLRIG